VEAWRAVLDERPAVAAPAASAEVAVEGFEDLGGAAVELR
jgi:hypothetical protein